MDKFELYKHKVRGFYGKHRRMPSYGELMKLVGFRSKSPAQKLVAKLIAVGMIAKDSAGKLIPKKLVELPVLGTIAAGFPSPAEEELLDTITLDEYLIPNRASTFLVEVTGDSMEGAGIRAGDLVLVERGRTPKDGDIVIAQVDGAWTMKYLRKKGTRVTLEAANRKYRPIVPEDELTIDAVVVAQLRKYH
jgi:repressor LexA